MISTVECCHTNWSEGRMSCNQACDDSMASADFQQLSSSGSAIATGGEIALEKETGDDSDVMWSLASNSFFVTGGICCVAATTWDMNGPPISGEEAMINKWVLYNFVWTFGLLVYLLNGIIDVLWATKALERQKQRGIRRDYRRSIKQQLSSGTLDEQEKKRKKRLLSKLNKLRTKRIFRRIRKHVGHRRELSSAVTFALAAALDLMAMGLGYGSLATSDTIELLEAAAIHTYLVSATFALCGRAAKPSGARWFSLWTNADKLEDMGDALFGIGTIVDVILCDTHFDDDVMYWPVISAALWLLDALFYLRSDFVTLYSVSATYKEFDTMDDDDDDSMTGVDMTIPPPVLAEHNPVV